MLYSSQKTSELKGIRERAAYNVGVEAVRQAALITAVMMEAQAGSQCPRQQAAVVALQALAEEREI